MSETYIKSGGTWGVPVTDIYRKVGGVWVPSTEVYQKQAGVWVNVFTAEIVVNITTNQSGLLDLSTLFSPSDWTAEKKKRVIVNSGVNLNATTSAGAVRVQDPTLATGWGGTVTLENRGNINGIGGAANSGTGGNAIYAGTYTYTAKKLIVENTVTGNIRGGGGGGGRGGNGGAGYFNYTATEGPFYSRPTAPQYWYSRGGSFGGSATWAGTSLGGGHGDNGFTQGIYFYYPVTEFENGATSYYSIARQYTATQSTSGGTGGNGGRGQGADGTNAAGSSGSAGGQNAGTGGTGGTGGTYGSNGNTGNTGGAGNNGSGSAGTTGGLAGIAYNSATTTVSNAGGQILGRIT